MGKYMRKGKGVGEVAVMELSQSSFGVRTRARALALEEDRKIARNSKAGSLNLPQPECDEPRQISYLELRSRRLEKVVRSATVREQGSQARALRKAVSERRPSEMSSSEMLNNSRFAISEDPQHSLSALASSAVNDRGRHNLAGSRVRERALKATLQSSIKCSASASLFPNSGARRARAGAAVSRSNSVSIPQDRSRGTLTRNQKRRAKQTLLCRENMDLDVEATYGRGDAGPSVNNSRNMEVEASFGENPTDHDGLPARDRRETTPNSYERDIEAPGSATRTPSTRNHRRSASASLSNRLLTNPSSNEIEEFFAGAEQQFDQRRFVERYNFDPVNDRPLPGRFQWVCLEP